MSSVSYGKGNICSDHQAEGIFYCESCQEIACAKCLSSKHKKCDWISIEEKCDTLKKTYESSVSAWKKPYLASVEKLSSENAENLSKVKDGIKNLQELEHVLQEHATYLRECKDDAEMFVAACENECDIRAMEGKIQAATTVKKEMDEPAILHLPILDTLQNTSTDLATAAAFTSMFKEENQETVSAIAFKTARPEQRKIISFSKLEEGKVWEVKDSKSAQSVVKELNTSSCRPSHISFSWTHPVKKDLESLIAASIPLEINVTYYDSIRNPSDESKKDINEDIQCILTCLKTQVKKNSTFVGHLNKETIEQLPLNYCSKIELLIRTKEDMEAANALSLTCDDMSVGLWVAKSLDHQDWQLGWDYSGCYNMRVYQPNDPKKHVTFHFSDLEPGQTDWLRNILTKIKGNQRVFQRIQSLYFPGATMNADVILGVMREKEVETNVHLPVNPKSSYSKDELTARYKAKKCVAYFDQ